MDVKSAKRFVRFMDTFPFLRGRSAPFDVLILSQKNDTKRIRVETGCFLRANRHADCGRGSRSERVNIWSFVSMLICPSYFAII